MLGEATARALARLFGSLRLSQPVLGVALEGRWDRRKSCTMMGSTWCTHARSSQVIRRPLRVSVSQRLRVVDQDQFQTVFKKIDRTMKITGVRGVDGGDR